MKQYSIFSKIAYLLILAILFGAGECPEEADQIDEGCPENAFFNASTNTCECMDMYVKFNDLCLPNCPDYSTFNPTTQECECNLGFVAVDDECVREDDVECQDNATWNTSTGSCECNQGFEDVNGECEPVSTECDDPNATFDETFMECKCNEGFVVNNSGDCIPFDITTVYGIYDVEHNCSASGVDHYFINIEELPNQPNFISVVNIGGIIEFSSMELNDTKTEATFQPGETIGGRVAQGGLQWEWDPNGNATNVTLNFQLDNELCNSTVDKVEQGDTPCGANGEISINSLRCQCDAGFQQDPESGECIPFDIYKDYDCDQSCSSIGDSEYTITLEEDIFEFNPDFMVITNLFQTAGSVRCKYKDDLSGAIVEADQFLNGGQLPDLSEITGEVTWDLQSDGSIENVVFIFNTDTGDSCSANLTAQ